MDRDITLYIKDIIENMDYAEEFIGNLSYEDFLLDPKTHYSVVRCIEIIGEASKNVPGNIRSKHRNIPYKKGSRGLAPLQGGLRGGRSRPLLSLVYGWTITFLSYRLSDRTSCIMSSTVVTVLELAWNAR
ncbi:HepT-like ribonuclease domain-containing protein [Candidatus Magnetobacterium casense]|uniref:DUF86 domain-containing protein n=1 Tax=Candidatus Magnetobacterium casense TaxID=1455061 RepID=A0ABS6RUL9_9BACT|nr:DUF86 domain-containing protein [Candidatus Magnetobacterium casensis]